jgi:hypothetical protein
MKSAVAKKPYFKLNPPSNLLPVTVLERHIHGGSQRHSPAVPLRRSHDSVSKETGATPAEREWHVRVERPRTRRPKRTIVSGIHRTLMSMSGVSAVVRRLRCMRLLPAQKGTSGLLPNVLCYKCFDYELSRSVRRDAMGSCFFSPVGAPNLASLTSKTAVTTAQRIVYILRTGIFVFRIAGDWEWDSAGRESEWGWLDRGSSHLTTSMP